MSTQSHQNPENGLPKPQRTPSLIEKFLRRQKKPHSSDRSASLDWLILHDPLPGIGRGHPSFRDYAKVFYMKTEASRLQFAINLFGKMDHDNDGQLETLELEHYISSDRGRWLYPLIAPSFFLGPRQTRISKSDFIGFILNKRDISSTVEVIKRGFELIDIDGSGKLGVGELFYSLNSTLKGVSREEIDILVDGQDDDLDGRLNLLEFGKIMINEFSKEK